MDKQTWQEKIKLLERQIDACKKEIQQVRENNSTYFVLMQNFLEYLIGTDEVDDEYRLTAQNFIKVKKEIVFLGEKISEIERNIQEIYNIVEGANRMGSSKPKEPATPESPNDISGLKEMIEEIYDLVKKDKESKSLESGEIDQGKIQGAITFRELQKFANPQVDSHDHTKPSLGLFQGSGIADPKINMGHEMGRFVSRHIDNKIPNKEKLPPKVDNQIKQDSTETKNKIENKGEDKQVTKMEKKSSWFHSILGQ